MTRYEMDYRKALEKMLDDVVHTYGHESKEAIRMAEALEKYESYCCYESWETVENIYKNIMKVFIK